MTMMPRYRVCMVMLDPTRYQHLWFHTEEEALGVYAMALLEGWDCQIDIFDYDTHSQKTLHQHPTNKQHCPIAFGAIQTELKLQQSGGWQLFLPPQQL